MLKSHRRQSVVSPPTLCPAFKPVSSVITLLLSKAIFQLILLSGILAKYKMNGTIPPRPLQTLTIKSLSCEYLHHLACNFICNVRVSGEYRSRSHLMHKGRHCLPFHTYPLKNEGLVIQFCPR